MALDKETHESMRTQGNTGYPRTENIYIIIIINKRLFVFTHLQKQLYDIRRYEYMPKWINISPTIFIGGVKIKQ